MKALLSVTENRLKKEGLEKSGKKNRKIWIL
jgi:hypothetical protein